jgi:hypothetical protein
VADDGVVLSDAEVERCRVAGEGDLPLPSAAWILEMPSNDRSLGSRYRGASRSRGSDRVMVLGTSLGLDES